MKKLKQKRFMTLIEVMIATFLTMILLTAITFFYRQASFMTKESDKLQQEQFKQSYLEKRLFNLLPMAISPRDLHNDFYFYTSEALSENGNMSLVFTYDHGVDKDAKMSNHRLGRLFLDSTNQLVLASYPSPISWDVNPNPILKKEILAEDIVILSFEFYVTPKKDRSSLSKIPKNLVDIQPENSWHKSWKSSYNQLPAMIKVHLTKKNSDKEIIFSFSLPNSDMVVMYEGAS